MGRHPWHGPSSTPLPGDGRQGIGNLLAIAGQPAAVEIPNPQDFWVNPASQPSPTGDGSGDFVSNVGWRASLGFFETHSGPLKQVLDAAYKAALTLAPILLTGESGVGKSVLARQIHEWSRWREQPFVVVDCASIPDRLSQDIALDQVIPGLIGSSIAHREESGILREGTVFFDNISELSELGQAGLLWFVEEQHFQSVFEHDRGRAPCRIIAAGNRDLAKEVAARRFREDLLLRIGVITLEVPPLRDRFEDVVPLANYLLSHVALITERPGLQFSSDAAAVLTRHRWPGNLRELRNAIERAAVMTRGDVITAPLLSKAIANKKANLPKAHHPAPSLEEVERHHILEILSQTGSLEQAAAILRINLTTLWRKRRRYNLIGDRRKPAPPR